MKRWKFSRLARSERAPLKICFSCHPCDEFTCGAVPFQLLFVPCCLNWQTTMSRKRMGNEGELLRPTIRVQVQFSVSSKISEVIYPKMGPSQALWDLHSFVLQQNRNWGYIRERFTKLNLPDEAAGISTVSFGSSLLCPAIEPKFRLRSGKIDQSRLTRWGSGAFYNLFLIIASVSCNTTEIQYSLVEAVLKETYPMSVRDHCLRIFYHHHGLEDDGEI